MLRNESTYKLPLNKNTYRAIKMQTGTTIDVEKFINDCINEYTDGETGNGLFNANNNLFWSESFLRRMQKYEDLKEKRSQAGKKAMQNRWGNKQNYNKVITKKQRKIKGISKNNKIITMLSKENNKVITKKQRKIKGISKNNKIITMLSKENNKVITNVIKNRNKVIAKNNKSNQIKSNQIKLKKIKLKDMKSIYPSDHKSKENKTLDEMMDEMEKMEFETIISNCEMHIFSPELSIEITEILKEMYMTPITRKRVLEVNSKKLLYALKNFAIANTKSRIQIPKAYFKKCILSALDQTELSTQYDTETIFEMEE